MRIQFSELQKLEITIQNEKARDFTQDNFDCFKEQYYMKEKQQQQQRTFGEHISKSEF